MHPETLAALVFWYPAFLFSICAHEAAHAWAALRLGDSTAADGGQVSLSPVPHMTREPIGMLVVPLLTAITHGWPMGWASAPYDPYWAERYPRRAAWMAAAGPAANLVLAIVAFAVMRLATATGFFEAPLEFGMSQWVRPTEAYAAVVELGFAAQLLSVLCSLNLLLAMFNLLPIPPLDGSAVITLLMPPRMAESWTGLVSMPGARLAGMFVMFQLSPGFGFLVVELGRLLC